MKKQASFPLNKIPGFVIPLLWIMGISGLGLFVYIDYLLILSLPQLKKEGIISVLARFIHCFTISFCAFTVIWILLKAVKTRPVFYFVLLLESFVLIGVCEQFYVFNRFPGFPDFWASFIAFIGIIFIRFSQEFPLQLTKAHIRNSFHQPGHIHWLVSPLSWLLKPLHTWLIFLPLFMAIALIGPHRQSEVRFMLITCMMLAVGCFYVRIQFHYNNRSQLKPLYWWGWSLLIQLFFYLYRIITDLLGLNLPDNIWKVLFMIMMLSIVITLLLSVYFTDLLDAAVVLRKTFLYGSLLLILLLLFGTLEHFVIHKLSHWLHLSNTLITSLFAGATGLLFHPLKEKLTHWMQQAERKMTAQKNTVNLSLQHDMENN